MAVLLGFALLGIFHVFGEVSAPSLDMRPGASWVVPWLGGLALISFLGDFPKKSVGAGNLGLINFEWSLLILLAHSILVSVIAYKFRLSPEEAHEHIERSREESRIEEQELAPHRGVERVSAARPAPSPPSSTSAACAGRASGAPSRS